MDFDDWVDFYIKNPSGSRRKTIRGRVEIGGDQAWRLQTNLGTFSTG